MIWFVCVPLFYLFYIYSIPEEGDGVGGISSRHIFSYKIVSDQRKRTLYYSSFSLFLNLSFIILLILFCITFYFFCTILLLNIPLTFII